MFFNLLNKNNSDCNSSKSNENQINKIPSTLSTIQCNNDNGGDDDDELLFSQKQLLQQSNYISETCDISNRMNDNNKICNQNQTNNKINNSDSKNVLILGQNTNKFKHFIKNDIIVLYLLILLNFLFIFLTSFLLYNHINKLNDIQLFNKNLKNDLTKEEIKKIIKNFLIEFKYSNEYNLNGVYENLQLQHKQQYQQYQQELQPNNLGRIAPPHFLDNNRKSDSNLKRKKRSFDENVISGVSTESEGQGPAVEFFHPKLRHELEKKDSEKMKNSGAKGAAPGGDHWVWLTSYSRIPYDAISGFCRATKEYCPPGPPGLPGMVGPKGSRGDIGLPGPPGDDGRKGSPGPRGPKGEPGLPGQVGVDGRDGIPGEPGLDGINGRAGADGINGKNGKDGENGKNGLNGRDGLDGEKGATGPQGPPGPPGPRGLTGPRGRFGKAGINGIPGIPGINAWKVKLSNGSISNELIIPPSITGADSPLKSIIVNEGDHLRLRCAATGHPLPHVVWRRIDGRPIPQSQWQVLQIDGPIFNLTKINRVHMGEYQCFADNGVKPTANQTFDVEVHFPPMIKIKNVNIYAANGSYTVLECEVEMSPDAVKYWERVPAYGFSTARLLDPGEKYLMVSHTDGYKSTMQLNITRIRPTDFGEYSCCAKNELGSAKATIALKDINGIKPPYNTAATGRETLIFGHKRPEQVAYEELCPPQTPCADCATPKDSKCRDSVYILHELTDGGRFEVTSLTNHSFSGLQNRSMNCVLYAVGKPVFHKFTDRNYGSWLKDPMPANEVVAEKIWATQENDTGSIFEYSSKATYRGENDQKKVELETPFRGNANIVYNGSFYYNARDSPTIVRFDLNSRKQIGLKLMPGSSVDSDNYLYTTEHNFMDFSADENGLWVIYSMPAINNTIIVKVDHVTLEIQYGWNISINHHKVGEMFIVCGVLYAIESVTERITRIRFAYDLYIGEVMDVSLPFTNPFKRTTTVGYNHRNKELYTWDKGNQLTYPIRYHDRGNGTSSEETTDESLNPQMQFTGYEIVDGGGAS